MIKLTLLHISILLPSIVADCQVHRDPIHGRCYELEELKLEASRLEFILEENLNSINTKSMHLAEKEKLIEDMACNIQFLQKSVDDIKNMQIEPSNPNERVDEIKTEVGLLLDARKENFRTLRMLESQVRDAEEKSDQMASQVEEMENIVTEQWIQIRQLEQALQITEMRTLNAQRKIESTECILMKFIKKISEFNHQSIFSMLDSSTTDKVLLQTYMVQASNQFKRIISVAQTSHHQLQASVKQFMEKNEFTAALANKEIVFFVASALITFPAMGAWMLYSACFS